MKLQNIDRRLLYLLLAIVVSIPLVIKGLPLPPPAITPPTQTFYDTIEKLGDDPAKKDKLVIISCNFGSGTLAENLSQTEAVITHIMKKKLKFALFAFNDPQGRELGTQTVTKLAIKYNYKYGQDWVNWGYRPPAAIVALLKAAVNDLPGAIGTDVQGTKLSDVPVMKNIHGANDVSLIVEVAAANTIAAWIQYYQRTGKEPIATLYCPTSVMAAEAFPYLETGQLQGMLVGLKGANEYEKLIGEPGFASSAATSLSYSHVLIIALIALGNTGMFLERGRQKGGR